MVTHLVRASVFLALAQAGMGLMPSPLRAARATARPLRGRTLASSTDPDHHHHPHDDATTTRRGILTSAAAAAAATIALGGGGARASAAAPIEAAESVALGMAGMGVTAPPTSTLSLAAGGLAGDSFVFPKMGLGAWAWGDALFWGYRPSEDEELQKTFDFAVDKVSREL